MIAGWHSSQEEGIGFVIQGVREGLFGEEIQIIHERGKSGHAGFYTWWLGIDFYLILSGVKLLP